MTLIAGTSNPELAAKIAERLGQPLAKGTVKTFADGEVAVSFKAADVSKKHCYII
jgi:phosphoribosylpyrophosphate synthetase